MATSFERIHRSNLVGMGVLPLTFVDGQTHASLGLDGTEHFSIPITDDVQPLQRLTVSATHAERGETSSKWTCVWTPPSRWSTTATAASSIPSSARWPRTPDGGLKAHPFKRVLWPTSGEPSGTVSATKRTTSTSSSRAKRCGSQTSSKTWSSKASVGRCPSHGHPAHRTSAAWPMTTMCPMRMRLRPILDPHQTLLGFRWFGDLSGNSTWNLKSIASAFRRCSAPTPSN